SRGPTCPGCGPPRASRYTFPGSRSARPRLPAGPHTASNPRGCRRNRRTAGCPCRLRAGWPSRTTTVYCPDRRSRPLRRGRSGPRGDTWRAPPLNRRPQFRQTRRAAKLDLVPTSRPLQPFADRAPHHPIPVALGQELQLFGEMGDALAPSHPGERGIGEIGPPVAALRTISVEYPPQMIVQVAEWIRLQRGVDEIRHLDADVGVLRERHGVADLLRHLPFLRDRGIHAHVIDDERQSRVALRYGPETVHVAERQEHDRKPVLLGRRPEPVGGAVVEPL